MSSFGLTAAAQHGTSSSSSGRSNRNSTILPSTGTTSDAYPSLYKRIGSSENIHTSSTVGVSGGHHGHEASGTNYHQTSSSSSVNDHHSSRSSQQSSNTKQTNPMMNNIRMSSSLTIQHDPSSN